MSQLSAEFEQTIEQINAKLAEAAKALREANELAKTAGYHYGIINSQYVREQDFVQVNEEDFEDLDAYDEACDRADEAMEEKYSSIDVSDLEAAMEEAGWSTSSSYC
jgi:hypothetical protein